MSHRARGPQGVPRAVWYTTAAESVCCTTLDFGWQTHLCGKWRHPTAAATQPGSTGRRAATAALLHSVLPANTCTAACSRSVASSACRAASPADCSRLRASAAQWATADPSSSAANCLPAGAQQTDQDGPWAFVAASPDSSAAACFAAGTPVERSRHLPVSPHLDIAQCCSMLVLLCTVSPLQ